MNSVSRRAAIVKKNLFSYMGLAYHFMLKVLYFGGIPLSFLYGKSNPFPPNPVCRHLDQASFPDVCLLHSHGKPKSTRLNEHGGSPRNDVIKLRLNN